MVPLCVAVGGAVGALARYALAGWVHEVAGARLPWGTLAVNLVGSFLIGFAVRSLDAVTASPELRALVAVGLLGGFTTFSAYTHETMMLVRDGAWLRAGVYSLGSLGLGLVAVGVGLALAGIVLERGV
jgi:CrcB protein